MELYNLEELNKIEYIFRGNNFYANEIYDFISENIKDFIGNDLIEYKFNGILFCEDKAPSMKYNDNNEYVISVPNKAKTDINLFIGYLSHEKVHAVSPSPILKPKYFEEGLACIMPEIIIRKFYTFFYNEELSEDSFFQTSKYDNYEYSRYLVSKLIEENDFNFHIFKEIRIIEPNLKKINKEHLRKYTKDEYLLNELDNHFKNI